MLHIPLRKKYLMSVGANRTRSPADGVHAGPELHLHVVLGRHGPAGLALHSGRHPVRGGLLSLPSIVVPSSKLNETKVRGNSNYCIRVY